MSALPNTPRMTSLNFTKLVIFTNALIPLALLLWDVWRKNVGANPLEFATRTTGRLTLVFVTLTIALTPFRKTFNINSLVKLRRMLGLFAFSYGVLHLLTYIWFDRLINCWLNISRLVPRNRPSCFRRTKFSRRFPQLNAHLKNDSSSICVDLRNSAAKILLRIHSLCAEVIR